MAHIINSDESQDRTNKASSDFNDTQTARPPRLPDENLALPATPEETQANLPHLTMAPAFMSDFMRNAQRRIEEARPENSDGPIAPKNR